MNDMMSPADMKALMGNENGGIFGGNGCIMWVIILFLFFFRGGNAFGGENATQNVEAVVQRGFDQNTLVNKLDGITNGLSTTTYALNDSIKNGDYALATAISQGNFDIQSQLAKCCCDNQKELLINRYEADKNSCAIINAVREDGEKTRHLITENKIEELQTKLLMANNAVQSRDFQLSQLAQTSAIENTILGKLGTFYTNPPCAPSPYPYGCGCGAYATV